MADDRLTDSEDRIYIIHHTGCLCTCEFAIRKEESHTANSPCQTAAAAWAAELEPVADRSRGSWKLVAMDLPTPRRLTVLQTQAQNTQSIIFVHYDGSSQTNKERLIQKATLCCVCNTTTDCNMSYGKN
jgi:hypothetical protein